MISTGAGTPLQVGGYDRWSWYMLSEGGGPLFTVEDGLALVPMGEGVELVKYNGNDVHQYWSFSIVVSQ